MISNVGEFLVDQSGRKVMLRGVNLPAKSPLLSGQFYDGSDLSFVGKPWPIYVAKEHAKRLKNLGMNVVRLAVPWEAVMHDGPNTFDEEYLSYFANLVSIFEKEEIYVDIDPHQDAFSRYSGGDGAPKWVFDLVGLIPENFYETLAATTEYEIEKHTQKPYPYLLWQTNLSKLACMTLFTLFWAGDTYAPNLQVQNFLQEQYLLFVESLAKRVRKNKNILSIATMNELSMGYIGNVRLDKVSASVKMGLMPTALEGFALGDGKSIEVENYRFTKVGFFKKGRIEVNSAHIRVWQKECIWKMHGVWDYDHKGDPVILKKDYFQTPHKDTFANDFYTPFAMNFYKRIRQAREKTCVLLQTQEFIKPPNWDLEKDGSDVIFGRHFYDPILTAFKWYQNIYNAYEVSQRVVFFKYFIDRAVCRQFSRLKRLVKKYIGDVPFLMGETGVVMDLNWGLLAKKGPATKEGDYTYVIKGIDRIFKAIEKNLINVCIWNYDISNTLEKGDDWNGENFSIYCSSLKDPIRAKEGWQRPYPQKTPGTPITLSYDRLKGFFNYVFLPDPAIQEPCEIYMPDFLMKSKYEVSTSSGKTEFSRGILSFIPDQKASKKAWIRIHFFLIS